MLQADTSDVLPPSGWFCHINKPSGYAFGLANDSTKPSGHGKSKKPGSPDFILIMKPLDFIQCMLKERLLIA